MPKKRKVEAVALHCTSKIKVGTGQSLSPKETDMNSMLTEQYVDI
jgi:hypothetical protein